MFGNDDAWIAGAIARACCRLSDLPLEVVVCHYRSINEHFKQSIDGTLSAMMETRATSMTTATTSSTSTK